MIEAKVGPDVVELLLVDKRLLWEDVRTGVLVEFQIIDQVVGHAKIIQALLGFRPKMKWIPASGQFPSRLNAKA